MFLENIAEWTNSSSCGAADPKKEEKPASACGSACGAADPEKEETPASSCGASDPQK